MSNASAPRGRTCSRTPRPRTPRARTLRSVALLTSGVLTLPALAGCSAEETGSETAAAPMDIAPAARELVEQGGTLRWAVDAVPATLNTFQADADTTTSRIAGAVLPSLFTLDERGRPQRNPDYLEAAKIVEREPKQVVLYKLSQKAVWSDGREIGAADFVAQWRALSGKDSAYWTARNAGYDRIEKIERGANDLEVRVTFAKPYADWQSLFTPLYPKEAMGTPASFNDGIRSKLALTAGPFTVQKVDRKAGTTTLVRNPRWWGAPAKLDSLVLRAVPRDSRAAALATGTVDLAEIDRSVADRIALAVRSGGEGPDSGGQGPGAAPSAAPSAVPSALPSTLPSAVPSALPSALPSAPLKPQSPAQASDDQKGKAARIARELLARKKLAREKLAFDKNKAVIAQYAAEQTALRGFVVRKSLEPAYTQLALNGESGPLADERVRRAVARALDRKALAEAVLKPLGLPARPVGSHLALAGQSAYADSSGALGAQDTEEAQALLADAGWTREGARTAEPGTKAGPEKSPAANSPAGNSPAANSPAVNSPAVSSPAANSPAANSPAVNSPAVNSPAVSSPAANSPAVNSPAAKAPAAHAAADHASDEGLYVVGDNKPGHSGTAPEDGWNVLAPGRYAALQSVALRRQADALGDSSGGDRDEAMPKAQDRQGPVAGAYAPLGTKAPAERSPVAGPLGKGGKQLVLRFVLPSGPDSEALRTVGDRIARMLDKIGIRTEITKVADDSYFKDHIASGDYDLALYSWPASAYPATDARPIFAKPEPAADGSLLVEQNYTRVGTDHIDQLFAQAVAELDEGQALELMKQADARIWAAAGSIPLYQRPQLVAAKRDLVNAGAFGFAAPRYQDIGFKKAGTSANGKNDQNSKNSKNDQNR
ncbi:ABC transporter substrate-binding protein [Streptomyces sp. NPDC054841]